MLAPDDCVIVIKLKTRALLIANKKHLSYDQYINKLMELE